MPLYSNYQWQRGNILWTFKRVLAVLEIYILAFSEYILLSGFFLSTLGLRYWLVRSYVHTHCLLCSFVWLWNLSNLFGQLVSLLFLAILNSTVENTFEDIFWCIQVYIFPLRYISLSREIPRSYGMWKFSFSSYHQAAFQRKYITVVHIHLQRRRVWLFHILIYT